MRPVDVESVKNNQFEIDNKKEVIRCARFIDKYKRDFFCFNENIDFELKNDSNKLIAESKYSIFTNGFRQTACNLNAEKTYVFLGCSFTFGEFLNDNETLPYNFSKLLNFESNVLNCGVRGHGTNRTLSILNSGIINRINNNAKVEHFFYSIINDHIRRNFRVTAGDSSSDNWLYKDGKWTRVSQPFGNIKVFFAKSYIFRKIFVDLIEKKYSNFYAYYLIDSLVEIDKIIRDEYNSKLTIIVWPEFTEKFITKLKETNIDLVFLPKDFKKYEKGYYEHPNPKSNEEIAEILYNHINKK
ncbi:MAG: hypothetical protein PHG84_03710 [Endomicrobiaceae bacterium]|nr:hypothetical protein [Endomicrobiaceae bacterium]MDD5102081.1 hypothetical protein [Endomicrobiaceae bacterium]